MKDILGTLGRHILSGAGVLVTYLATVDMQSIADITTDLQAIIGALMVIGPAAMGIRAKLKSRKALVKTAQASAAAGAPVVKTK